MAAAAKRQLVCWCLVATVAVASAQQGRFTTVNFPKFEKRRYQATCTENKGPSCYVGCPKQCPDKCLAMCKYCLTFCMCDLFPGTSCGDPRFTGGDGNTFYFHGERDRDFCIVSDTGLHINAHFIGNHNQGTKRDFTWVQALGITFGNGHRLYIGARKAAEWDEEEDHVQIALDGEPVEVEAAKNARWVSNTVRGLSVTRIDTVNTIIVELEGVFSISVNVVPITDEDSRIHSYGKTRKDSLMHLDLGFKFHALTKGVDGVLGQTYRSDYVSKVSVMAKMPIMGGAPKYLSTGLFSTDCAVSQFHRSIPATTEAFAS
ncbi:hypothetical protein ACQ4PT_053709 [Festuca glaucescens]